MYLPVPFDRHGTAFPNEYNSFLASVLYACSALDQEP
jgi:hypothetical protein